MHRNSMDMDMEMRPFATSSVALLLGFILPCVAAGYDETPLATTIPSRSADQMLRRFVDECVQISPGKQGFPREFLIGAEKPNEHEGKRRSVKLENEFRISKFEVTQELYAAVMGKNPSRWKGPRNSVEMITWNDALSFCEKLTNKLQHKNLISTDQRVRLPTAIEWEYCCRAGSASKYCFGDRPGNAADGTELLDQFAWHTGNAAGNDPAVGVLKPNKWGLYDVHGYLWEFVSDDVAHSTDRAAASKDKVTRRQIRGGSWQDEHTLLSSSTYLTISDDTANDATGFRCVIAVDHPAKNMPHR